MERRLWVNAQGRWVLSRRSPEGKEAGRRLFLLGQRARLGALAATLGDVQVQKRQACGQRQGPPPCCPASWSVVPQAAAAASKPSSPEVSRVVSSSCLADREEVLLSGVLWAVSGAISGCGGALLDCVLSREPSRIGGQVLAVSVVLTMSTQDRSTEAVVGLGVLQGDTWGAPRWVISSVVAAGSWLLLSLFCWLLVAWLAAWLVAFWRWFARGFLRTADSGWLCSARDNADVSTQK